MTLFPFPLCSNCCVQDGGIEVLPVDPGFDTSVNENGPFFNSKVLVSQEEGQNEEEVATPPFGAGQVHESLEAKQLREWLLPKTQFFFKHEGACLHIRHFLPQEANKLRGTIVYLHGLNCHVNGPGMATLGNAFAAAGFGMLSFDLVGNGYSEGLRSYVEDFETVFRSILHFVRLVMCKDSSDKNVAGTEEVFNLGIPDNMLFRIRSSPYFFMGESMGGMLATYASIRLKQACPPWLSQHHGTVLVAPALAVNVPPKAVVMLLRSVVVPLASKELMPQAVSSASKPEPSHVYRDPEQAKVAMQDDYHAFPGIGLQWRREMRWATAGAFAAIFSTIDDDMTSVDCPLLVLHDPLDQITKVDGSRRLVQVAASQDKELIERPGALHDIVSNEFDWFMGKVLPWLVQRC